MLIEIGAPAMLTLGVVRFTHEDTVKSGLLGLTLQHPPVLMAAQAHKQCSITGARAHISRQYARRYLAFHQLTTGVEVDIELAIPAFVGLSSDPILGLTTARVLAWINDHPLEETVRLAQEIGLGPQDALAIAGFDQGGLLLVDHQSEQEKQDVSAMILRRETISHPNHQAWALVLVFPSLNDDPPETIEADRLATLWHAAPYLEPAQGKLALDQIWAAIESDDITAFGQGLRELQRINETALVQAGTPLPLSEDEQAILELMRTNGALAWGRSPTGTGLYGLVKGGQASADLQKKLSDHLGFFGGTVMATITDNRGAHHIIMEDVSLSQYIPANMRR